MPDDIGSYFTPSLRYAVVGATTDRVKYGYRVLMDLHGAGFDVVGVNPKYHLIEGVPCYPSLSLVPQRPDVAIFVVPPTVSLATLDECVSLGLKKIWFQPGAESEAIRARVRKLGLQARADGSCIMVAKRSYT